MNSKFVQVFFTILKFWKKSSNQITTYSFIYFIVYVPWKNNKLLTRLLDIIFLCKDSLTDFNLYLVFNNNSKMNELNKELLLNFKNIRVLDIKNAKITSPEILSELKQLEIIYAEGSNIPEDIIEKMRREMPNCKIHF